MSKPKFDPKEKFSKLKFGGRARPDPPHIVVRLTRELELYDDGERYEEERLRNWRELAALWAAVLRLSPEARLRPLYRSLSPVALKRLIAAARCGCGGENYRPGPFFAYFQIVGADRGVLTKIVDQLKQHPNVVANAYIERVGPPPAVNTGGEPDLGNQFYLNQAPSQANWLGGIDARYAWGANNATGGDGAGVRIIDVERGWFHDHVDFPLPRPGLLFGQNVRPSAEHGAAVLGILCAQDRQDGEGGIGIVPHATSVNCVSYVESLDGYCNAAVANPAAAIGFAASQLGPGDVMLIEATLYEREIDEPASQPAPGPELMLPLEANEANREAIRLATQLGITVVEAGGNGTDPKDGSGFGDPPLDMNTWPPAKQVKPLLADSQNSAYVDCGAIMVSAALVSGDGPPERLSWAPRGLRVDCFAQAQGVYSTLCYPPGTPATNCSTAGYVGGYAPPTFGGTSAAAAIVAGAVAVIQGLARAKSNPPFTPAQIRAMLKNPAVNTPVYDETDPQTNLTLRRVAGVMPDLRRILAGYLAL